MAPAAAAAAAAATEGAAAASGSAAAVSSAEHAARVQRAEQFVRQSIAGHDSSHDYWHVERVRNTTLTLAEREGLQEAERQLAELAALLHDVADHKYSADLEADRCRLQRFLAADLALSQQDQDTVMFVIDSMGFNAELARQQQAEQKQHEEAEQQAQQQEQQQRQQRILGVVQDADRLDAIGAIGIARCLTFGGRFNRVLHDPAVPPRTVQQLTQKQYTDKSVQQTTLNHFHEKLLKLKGLMRTAAGREVAEGRHTYMEQFLQRFHDEWQGKA